MQAVYVETDTPIAPRVYRNRPSPSAFKIPDAEQLRDVVYLVEADPDVQEAVSSFLAGLDIKVITFTSANECLNSLGRDSAACFVLNICLPDLCGLELQRRLNEKSNPPVIFIGDQCDIASTVCAMKAGAIDFLTKPFDLLALFSAVKAAFTQDRKRRQRKSELAKLQERFALLTPREREVLPLVVGGLLNKQAASILGISEVTLQIHRSQVTRKMQAESFADLVRMAVKLRIPYWRETSGHEQWQDIPTFGVGKRSISPQSCAIR